MAVVNFAGPLLINTRKMIDLLASVDPLTLSGVLATGIAGLSGAVVHLYKSQFSLQREVNERVTQELRQCESDRADLWRAIIKIDPNAEELRTIK